MKYRIKEYDIWEDGKRVDSAGNPHQEDSIYPMFGKGASTDRLFILCDGMGGHAAGEVASATVCEALSGSIMRQQPDAEGEFTDEMLRQGIADAYDALDAKDSDTQGKKMGTTLTLLKLHAGGATIAHMGDSRVYHIRPGKDAASTEILYVTRDHSLVNDLVRAGEMTEEEARISRQKNIITRAMQPNTDPRHKADIYHTVDIKPGDYFYLCSDGMLEQMTDENLRFNFSEITGSNENKVNILKQATSQNNDNHSAIIVQVTDVIDPLPVAEKPVAATTPADPKPIIAEPKGTNPTSDNRNRAAGGGRPNIPTNNMPEPVAPVKSNLNLVWLAICVAAVIVIVVLVWLLISKPKDEERKTDTIKKIENVFGGRDDLNKVDNKDDNKGIKNDHEVEPQVSEHTTKIIHTTTVIDDVPSPPAKRSAKSDANQRASKKTASKPVPKSNDLNTRNVTDVVGGSNNGNESTTGGTTSSPGTVQGEPSKTTSSAE